MKRQIYTPKKGLVDGYKLGKKFLGKMLVAVPATALVKNKIIAFGNKIMDISKRDPVAERTFPDKYGRGSYKLYYYEWQPKDLQIGSGL